MPESSDRATEQLVVVEQEELNPNQLAGNVALFSPDGTPYSAPGGAGAGTPVVRKFPFAFDTPDLLTGAPLYTPTIGDILLDGWVEIGTAWNGTTPKGDFGEFAGSVHYGLYLETSNVSIDMSHADDDADSPSYGYLLSYYNQPLSLVSIYSTLALTNAFNESVDANVETQMLFGTDPPTDPPEITTIPTVFLDVSTGLVYQWGGSAWTSPGESGFTQFLNGVITRRNTRTVPGKFISDNPIKMCVSQNGHNNGADPGSTQGEGILYLVTATPV